MALAESCISRHVARETADVVGAVVDVRTEAETSNLKHPTSVKVQTPSPKPEGRVDGLLFGEAQGRVVISVAGIDAGKVLAQAKMLGIPAMRLGTVGGDNLKIVSDGGELECGVAELHDLWWNSIARAMG